MPVNAEEFFNELLPFAMERNPESVSGRGYQYTFIIIGEGEWSVDIRSNPSVMPGPAYNSNCTITMAPEDFQEVYQNPNNLIPLSLSGRMQVEGDSSLVQEVPEIFHLVRRHFQ
jgi:hypothetical protein